MKIEPNMQGADIDRKAARQKAEENSKHNDMKQHADKLIQGFQKLTDSHAKRAIWELFQNAIDLSEHAEIVIQHTSEALIFKHNGKPFDDNTLNCLIKQVSSKSAESNDEEIGQYGTGFITTHSFGRKILLSGSLSNEGAFIPLSEFTLDRTAKTSPELIVELVKQQDTVFDLIETGKYEDVQANFTEFAYITESDLQKSYALEAIKSLPIILPYVMLLNKRLQKVTVVDKAGKSTLYQKGTSESKGDLVESTIFVDKVPQTIYTIENEDPQITVILPLQKGNEAFIFDDQLSKLFLYYPLIGTELFGINFIIHSKHFSPTEQRDGIYLKSKTEQVQQNEEDNRKLIQKSSEMIFDFVEANASKIINPLNLAQINFNINNDKQPLLNEYFSGLKSVWIDKFKTFPLVETEIGNLKPDEAAFFHTELLVSPDAFDSIYILLNRYWKNIPKKDLVGRWTSIINEWNIQSITYITAKALVLKIEGDGNLNNFAKSDDLKAFYLFLIENGHGDHFNNQKLLPNIKGEFRQFSALNSNINLPNVLIEIADTIMPDVPKRLINPEFIFNLALTPYSRKNFTSDFNNQVSTVVKDDTLSTMVPKDYLGRLIDYCKLTTVAETSSIPARMMKLICTFYGHNEDLIVIPVDKEDELDVRSPQRRLLRLFLNDISKQESKWVAEHLDFLKEVIQIGSNYHDFAEPFKTLNVYPNQLNELTNQASLQVDKDIPYEIKDLYDKVVKPKLPIRATLVHEDFVSILKDPQERTTRSLTEQIESVFSSDGQYSKIKDHPFQEDIIAIIQRIMQDEAWGRYFPSLHEKRANVMLDKVGDGQITSDVFSIINLKPSQINKLGELARDENMDRIISLGITAFADEQETSANFQFKHEIGKRIEILIKEKLGQDLGEYKVDTEERQDGQDIIISLNKTPIYYIEVKSRWNSKSSIMMSKNQFLRAVENKDKYALCAVEMSDYEVGKPERHKVNDVSIIFDRINFVDTIGLTLQPLINGVFKATNPEIEVTLTGDYKVTIPQTLITKDGKNIEKFENDLIARLRLSKQ